MRDNHAGPPPEQNVSLGMMFLFSEIIIGMGISALVKQISGDVSFFVISPRLASTTEKLVTGQKGENTCCPYNYGHSWIICMV